MDISQTINKHGSDKDRNGYTPIYHTLLDKIKKEELNFLEIGIGTMIPNVSSSMLGYGIGEYKPGASLRSWRDYLINSRIYGFDVQPDTQFSEERIQTFLCDSTNTTSVNHTLETLNNIIFDIIIDDGSHYFEHQLQTLSNLFPHLKENGIYIIEDIGEQSPLNTNPFLIQNIIGDYPFFYTGLKNNLCVIYKNKLKSDYSHLNNW